MFMPSAIAFDITKVGAVEPSKISFAWKKLQVSFCHFYNNLMCKKIEIRLITSQSYLISNFRLNNLFGIIKGNYARLQVLD
jgi:hypothetical protein